MNLAESNAVLNRLLAIHNRSLPMYLHYAAPWLHRGEENARLTLDDIVADQQRTVERLGRAILENGGVVENNKFPMHYTGYNDVALDYLLNELIANQQALVRETEEAVARLPAATRIRALVEETLGEARAHLEALQELQGDVCSNA